MLALMGPATYTLLQNLVVPAQPEDKTFDDIVKILDAHMNPAPNKYAERIKFRERRQKECENIQQFAAELKRLSVNCCFSGGTLDENLFEQFLVGLRDEKIKQRLLYCSDRLDFAKALEEAVAMEITTDAASKMDGKDVHSVRKEEPRKTKTLHNKNETPKRKPCYRCGSNDHQPQKCPCQQFAMGSKRRDTY